MLCGSLDRKGVWGRMDTCVCVAESLCSSPETITALLIGYAPAQNEKLKRKSKQASMSQTIVWARVALR